jgi:hypothetical protein
MSGYDRGDVTGDAAGLSALDCPDVCSRSRSLSGDAGYFQTQSLANAGFQLYLAFVQSGLEDIGAAMHELSCIAFAAEDLRHPQVERDIFLSFDTGDLRAPNRPSGLLGIRGRLR